MGTTLSVTALVGLGLWAERTAPGGFLPHGICFTWQSALLWIHVISDGLIGLAYLSIPLGLFVLVRKRRDIPFNWIFLLFGLFIVSCGITHLVSIWTIWNPNYWFSASTKAITAAASVVTAVAMVPLIPRVLALPTTEQLKRANRALQDEIAAREELETQLRRAHHELEERVDERTAELVQARAVAESLRVKAENANRMKDTFLAKVSHELRTPLQATLSWSNVLMAHVKEATAAHSAAHRIANNVAMQGRLIDDLLDISRILSGRLGLEFRPTTAEQVVERALGVVRPAAAKAGVELAVRLDLHGARMVTDSARLEQVLWNLLNNAIQASSAGRTVGVAAKVEEGQLVVEVRDEGRGLSQEDLQVIFEPFRQAHANGHQGLGLGLAIARNIIALLGGQLSAHSEGPGKGARFAVRVPLVGGPVTEAEPATLSREQEQRLRATGVLYVEDNPDIADAVAESLRPWVRLIDVCYTADEALHLADPQRHDLILSDVHLGNGQTGYQLLAALRRRFPSFSSAPAIALSAFGSAEDAQTSRQAGFRAHLVKPVHGIDLARAIADARLPSGQ